MLRTIAFIGDRRSRGHNRNQKCAFVQEVLPPYIAAVEQAECLGNTGLKTTFISQTHWFSIILDFLICHACQACPKFAA